MRDVAPGPATVTVPADRVEPTVEITVVPDPEQVAPSVPDVRTEGTSRSDDGTRLAGAPPETGTEWRQTIRTASSRGYRRWTRSHDGSRRTRQRLRGKRVGSTRGHSR